MRHSAASAVLGRHTIAGCDLIMLDTAADFSAYWHRACFINFTLKTDGSRFVQPACCVSSPSELILVHPAIILRGILFRVCSILLGLTQRQVSIDT